MKIAGISAKVAHTHVEKHHKPEDGMGVIMGLSYSTFKKMDMI